MSGMSARDAAFLQEMGIGPLWTLRDVPTAAELAPEDEAAAVQPIEEQAAAAAPLEEAAPVEQAETAETAIARMGWDELRDAVANCSRCGACKDGRKPVFGAGAVLTLGQIAANALLDQPLSEPLAGSRGNVHELHGVPLVATLHPGELLRRGADKALAWADLCRARAAHARSG
jgi:hypothetical protein